MYYINIDRTTKNRYDLSKFLEWLEGGFDIFTSYFLERLYDIPKYGNVLVTKEEARMDLISYKVYGYVQMQFILMFYNNILDRNNLIIGDILSYPSITDLESLYFSLPNKQYTLENNNQ